MNLFYQPHIPDGIRNLDPEESRHCIKVLRYKSGDIIHLTDGRGAFYEAVITDANSSACQFELKHTRTVEATRHTVHIAISPTKNADRIEWFVEKATEIGVDQITLLECENTERTFIKTARLEKVAVSAMKQSLKAFLPVINSLTSFKDFVERQQDDQKFIAFVDTTNPVHLKSAAAPGTSSVVLIGPEGDFSPEELKLAIDHGFIKVSLGSSRLRTETAGLVACHTIHLLNE